MSKALKALERFKQPQMMCDLDWQNRIDIIEKSLKALEIIKHFIKSTDFTFIFLNDDKKILIIVNDEYEYWYECKTQEEYDLLKEILLQGE